MEKSGELFLHQKDPKLHLSEPVEHEKRRKKIAGEEVSQKPAEKISDWLNVIERTHLGHRDDPRVMERIKNSYHKKYVIKPEDVPEEAFLLEQRIARQQGWGNVEITDEFKKQKIEQIRTNQKTSLDKWIDYLSSKDAAYPMWAKYWAFNSMLQMGKFEKKEKEIDGEIHESGQFAKRTKDTVASFPTLNPRALAMTIGAMSSKVEQQQKPKNEREPVRNLSVKLTEPEFHQLLSTDKFSKLYTQFLIEIPEYSTEGLRETRGEWKKYNIGSDPKPLVDSLEGYPLEWCTADIDTARTQLADGDFYVYYSNNELNEPNIPRVAIRMSGDQIAEVRGIAPDQNLDPYISDVVKKKLTEFPDGKAYEKKSADMKRLTEIDEKNATGKELNKDDLRFLYQFDSKIEGFGYEKDPRIGEILNGRDAKKDIFRIIPQEDMGEIDPDIFKETDNSEGYDEDIVDDMTSYDFTERARNMYQLMKIYKKFNTGEGYSIDDLKFLYQIDSRIEGFNYHEDPRIGEITNSRDMKADLSTIFGVPKEDVIDLDRNQLIEIGAKNLKNILHLVKIYKKFNAGKDLTTDDLKFSEEMHRQVETFVEGMDNEYRKTILLRIFGIPEENFSYYGSGNFLCGHIVLHFGDLDLSDRRASEQYENIYDDQTEDYWQEELEPLHLPKIVTGSIDLGDLVNTDDVILPKKVGGDINLGSLQSAKGLKMPEIVGGTIFCSQLQKSELENLKKYYPKHNFSTDSWEYY